MTLTIGTEAPQFDLPGVDGRNHSLDDYADAQALVLIQSCNHCPYVQAWEGRMIDLQREYGDRGVRIVAVNSNDATTHPEDSFDEMKARAEREGFNFDYLYDESQDIARALGSERTPEVFLINRDRRLVYHGAIDDAREQNAVSQRYLRDALEAVVEGREPDVADTPAVGCTVKWRA
jgi:peroxiredoxin